MEPIWLPDREKLTELGELKKKQDEVVGAASSVWGSLNQEAGAVLLRQAFIQKRIQFFILAVDGSFLDTRRHTDAACLLWDQSYMPINFKSSEYGKREHDEHYGKWVPALVVNRVEDPKLERATEELLRLIATWYGNFTFENHMLVPCSHLLPDSPELLELRDEVERHFNGCIAGESTRKIHICRGPTSGHVEAHVSFPKRQALIFEFYKGPKLVAWLGKKKRIIIVLPPGGVGAEEFKEAIGAGIAKRDKF